MKNDQKVEALELLNAVLPEAKAYTTEPNLYWRAMDLLAQVLGSLNRFQEAHETPGPFTPVKGRVQCAVWH